MRKIVARKCITYSFDSFKIVAFGCKFEQCNLCNNNLSYQKIYKNNSKNQNGRIFIRYTFHRNELICRLCEKIKLKR